MLQAKVRFNYLILILAIAIIALACFCIQSIDCVSAEDTESVIVNPDMYIMFRYVDSYGCYFGFSTYKITELKLYGDAVNKYSDTMKIGDYKSLMTETLNANYACFWGINGDVFDECGNINSVDIEIYRGKIFYINADTAYTYHQAGEIYTTTLFDDVTIDNGGFFTFVCTRDAVKTLDNNEIEEVGSNYSFKAIPYGYDSSIYTDIDVNTWLVNVYDGLVPKTDDVTFFTNGEEVVDTYNYGVITTLVNLEEDQYSIEYHYMLNINGVILDLHKYDTRYVQKLPTNTQCITAYHGDLTLYLTNWQNMTADLAAISGAFSDYNITSYTCNIMTSEVVTTFENGNYYAFYYVVTINDWNSSEIQLQYIEDNTVFGYYTRTTYNFCFQYSELTYESLMSYQTSYINSLNLDQVHGQTYSADLYVGSNLIDSTTDFTNCVSGKISLLVDIYWINSYEINVYCNNTLKKKTEEFSLSEEYIDQDEYINYDTIVSSANVILDNYSTDSEYTYTYGLYTDSQFKNSFNEDSQLNYSNSKIYMRIYINEKIKKVDTEDGIVDSSSNQDNDDIVVDQQKSTTFADIIASIFEVIIEFFRKLWQSFLALFK